MKLAILPLIALISAATVSARLGLTQPSRDLQKSDGPRLLSPISSSSYPPKRLAFSVCPPKAPNLPEFESDKVSRYCFKNNIQSDCKKCSTEVCDWSTCPFCQNMPGCRRVHKPFRFEVAAGCFKNQLQAVSDIESLFFQPARSSFGFDVELSLPSHTYMHSNC